MAASARSGRTSPGPKAVVAVGLLGLFGLANTVRDGATDLSAERAAHSSARQAMIDSVDAPAAVASQTAPAPRGVKAGSPVTMPGSTPRDAAAGRTSGPGPGAVAAPGEGPATGATPGGPSPPSGASPSPTPDKRPSPPGGAGPVEDVTHDAGGVVGGVNQGLGNTITDTGQSIGEAVRGVRP